LRRRASITYSWDTLPGEPAVGWHAGPGGCWEKDESASGIVGSDAATGAALVAEIEARGPGRVLRVAARPAPSAAVAAAR
jgi:hypothetical protein